MRAFHRALLCACVAALPCVSFAQGTVTNRAPATTKTNDPISRIRDEGLNRSQVMPTLSYITDVIGPRLTGSPSLRRANNWTRDRLESWGLTNAHLEEWGPFGRGWSLQSFSAQVTAPYAFPLIASPKAWTPGFAQPITAEVIYVNATNAAVLEKFKGKLKGAIVLTGAPRDVKARWEPFATRMHDTNLLRLANAAPSTTRRSIDTPSTNRAPVRIAQRSTTNQMVSAAGGTTNINAAGAGGPPGRTRTNDVPTRTLEFLRKEGAALVVSPSSQGDAGTLFVAAASVPTPEPSTNASSVLPPRVSAWQTNAPAIPPQIMLAAEDYNRLVRMLEQGEHVKMTVDMKVQFHDDGLMPCNTVAEIPGTDLKDELVMIGAHLDSWHSGTGATDNGAGVAAVMEAVRILKALDLKPRRTVRVALWSGEEQGLLGSRAYVTRHFGYYTNVTNVVAKSPRAEENDAVRPASTRRTSASQRKLVRQDDYEKLSAYFNLDNGTGQIRGVYMQGNEAVRPLFRRWLAPFADLGAETLTAANTGGTDHLSFDGIGLPGFQFIQDPIDYFTRTHHSNADVYERAQADDLKQAATIMAAFLYNAATIDEKLPRKPAE